MAPWLATPCYRADAGSRDWRQDRAAELSQLQSISVLALAVVVAAAPIVIALYAYVGYPAIIWALARRRPERIDSAQFDGWPSVTVTVPVYNEVSTIAETLERLLELDYPSDRLQLLVLSDASDDGTDEVVRNLGGRGVELMRAPSRRGKTAAENAAVAIARGEIIVNVDATVAIAPGSLKHLVRAFDDPNVGVASGRDISVGAAGKREAGAESGYTGYEMWLRGLETRVGSIVGASGCFYGIRRSIRVAPLPSGLSWDFASTLVAREQGYRSVSVPAAICFVPRTSEIRVEMKRKTRTMARGLNTLFYFRSLLNPFKYGAFAIMLVSHKLFRWVPYLLMPVAILALAFLATTDAVATILLAVFAFGVVAGAAAIRFGSSITFKPLTLAGFVVAAVTAGFLAWVDALRGTRLVIWDPTPRPSITRG
ncbi:MAG: hypothetical protein QOD47_391 [Gemmatimonadaceae bacterium]|jgi:cellulose synthase/poly-beta-1,6-N-acetylglucosamine synthase-like glycosyltransferase|nr:hypothetical protein [Gemmatimonadaceae bacterium]